jgi:hypothetical protein
MLIAVASTFLLAGIETIDEHRDAGSAATTTSAIRT